MAHARRHVQLASDSARGAFAGLVALLTLGPTDGAGQQMTWPPPGARVRVVVPEAPYLRSDVLSPLSLKAPARLGRQLRLKNNTLRLDGRVVAHNAEHFRLELERPQGEIQLAVSDASQLQIHTGRSGHGLFGALIGGTITGYIGFQFQQALADNPGDFGLVLVGALPGALVGLLIGTAIKTDVWRPAPDY